MDNLPWNEIITSAGGAGAAIIGGLTLIWRKLNRIENALVRLAASTGYSIDSDGKLLAFKSGPMG